MQIDLKEKSLDLFREKCHEHGLKITPQRVAIYQILTTSKLHPSAETVFRLVREKFPHISFDTVNRTLLTLSQIGLVDVIEGWGDPRRYDPNMTPHHHFYCVNCGEIKDFRRKEYDELALPERIKTNCTVFTKRVVINGLCEKCSKGVKA
jgi:Fur family peroxide stress response transcriptional regulator